MDESTALSVLTDLSAEALSTWELNDDATAVFVTRDPAVRRVFFEAVERCQTEGLVSALPSTIVPYTKIPA